MRIYRHYPLSVAIENGIKAMEDFEVIDYFDPTHESMSFSRSVWPVR